MTATPVGDYLRRRYPPNDGATHWIGEGDDPGCSGGAHPACLYDAAWREALGAFAGDLDEIARTYPLLPPEQMARELLAAVHAILRGVAAEQEGGMP